MKNITTFIIIFILAIPTVSLAAPVSWDFSNGVLQPLQSMLTSLVRIPSLTATSATTTNLAVTSHLNLFGTIGTALSDFCVAITGGAGLCDGTDATGGGGGGSISTSTVPTTGNLSYWTSASTLGDVATGTLSESVLGLDLSNSTRGLVGGSASFSLTSGYEIPTTTRMATWDAKGNGTVTSVDMSVPLGLTVSGNPVTNSGTLTVSLTNGYTIPSTTRTTNWDTAFGWGNHAVAGYDQVTTAGDGLTRTLNDFDFDGGAVPAGALGGTWASPTVDDDGHNHTSASLSGIDISADTNLSADGTEIILTGDALSLGTSLTFTNATTTNFDITGSLNLFGGGAKTTNNAVCIQLTGSADLCDGADAGGAGGAQTPWTSQIEGAGYRLNNAGAVVVASTTYNYTGALLSVATSSDSIGQLLNIFATTSIMNETTSLSEILFPQDNGNRIAFGANTYWGNPGTLDQYTFHGRVSNDMWNSVECPIPVGLTAVTSDTPTAAGIHLCTNFDFYEDTAATLTNLSGSGFSYGQLGTVAATDGAGFFVRGLTGGWMVPATSTPSFEVTARIGTIPAGATTTRYYIGYSNLAVAGTTYETEPTSGCYFTASSTEANWRAICRTSASVVTNVNTGVASTTNGVAAGGGGKFRLFRIDMDADSASFYIANGTTDALTEVAEIITTLPSTVTMNTGVWFGRTTGVQAVQFDFFNPIFKWRKVIPNN